LSRPPFTFLCIFSKNGCRKKERQKERKKDRQT
jgi:hypothetical protein